ncbi:hypothetical protein D9M68_813870 [compost metagenome]
MDLPQVNIAHRQIGVFQQLPDSRYRTDADVLGVHSREAITHQSRHGLEPLRLGRRPLHQHQRRSCIVGTGDVTGVSCTIPFDYRVERSHAFNCKVTTYLFICIEQNHALA